MLQGHKSPGTLVGEIKMLRASHHGAVMIVEGKDDVRFWRPRCHATCDLIDGEGKQNVIGAVQRLDVGGALGVVDSDFERLTGGRIESSNLLYTDAHDLECLLCRSSALDKVLAEHGNVSKIHRFESAGIDVRTALLERALVFGRLRFAALLARPSVKLQVKVQQFVDEKTWTVDDETLICRALANSPHDADAVTSRLGQLADVDPWHVVRGHDMITILRIGLRGVLGDLPTSIGTNDIARLFRAGMSPEDLRDTGLWADLRAWEAANRPYAVLVD